MKKIPGDIILLYIHVYHKWRSYDIWFLKYKVWQTEIFVILGYFLPFQPPDNLENQNFKIEKNTWRYCHFTHLHHKLQSFDVRFTKIWSATDHSGLFFAFSHPYAPRKSKFRKNEKSTWRYYHFTNINDSHMRHGSSGMQCNRQNFFVILDCFMPFYPLPTWKVQILKQWKKHLEILSFYTCLP